METQAIQLEKQHVHGVYEKTASYLSNLQGKAWPRVRQFLLQQEPGSLVADIGCGTGKYLSVNPHVYTVGCDLCCPLVEKAQNQGKEVLVCDNLQLPFRDRVFTAVISIGVIHHFSTPKRRICAIKEIARTTASGGLIMIYVWAQEQRRRRFQRQDVLVPWNTALCSRSSSESGEARSSVGGALQEITSPTALRGTEPTRPEPNGRLFHSLGSYVPVGRCCVKIPAKSENGNNPHAGLVNSLRSWFFSKSLDESTMKGYIGKMKNSGSSHKWAESAILVQPGRHNSMDLDRGGSLMSDPSFEEDDVFIDAVNHQEKQWCNVSDSLREINGAALRHSGNNSVTDRQRFPTVKSTNDLNCLKKRGSTDSLLETMEVARQRDGAGDNEDLMRYYHVFTEGELNHLIEENVPELRVISSCFDHGNWCVIAKKDV